MPDQTTPTRGPATSVVIQNIARLKPDHQTLMRTLLADAGMGADTLETLVEHLLEEEGPALQQVVARTKLGVSAALASTALRAAHSVGDLRAAHTNPISAPKRGTVGPLR